MELNRPLLLYAFPLLVLIAALEALYILKIERRPYPWRESAASLAVAVGMKLSGAATAGLMAGIFAWLWDYRLLTLPLESWWSIALLFIGVEFCYYWQHRVMHECRWFWATHAVHHSPQHINLSGAYRIGWTGALTGAALFYVPLVLLGFHPAAVVTAVALNLLYQFWLHTELVPKLGWLEKVFNTPSNHRVHHATNPRYLDSNYGGVLIVFDRLFGTYVEENAADPCRYGLVHQIESHNPLRIVFREWAAIGADIAASGQGRTALGYLFGPPGWSPDGSRSTTRDLKAAGFATAVPQVRTPEAGCDSNTSTKAALQQSGPQACKKCMLCDL